MSYTVQRLHTRSEVYSKQANKLTKHLTCGLLASILTSTLIILLLFVEVITSVLFQLSHYYILTIVNSCKTGDDDDYSNNSISRGTQVLKSVCATIGYIVYKTLAAQSLRSKIFHHGKWSKQSNTGRILEWNLKMHIFTAFEKETQRRDLEASEI